MTIQAIETSYNGFRFRSRLEARWAVFFDTLGVMYRYEDQGYAMGVGGHTRYLPDFYMPAWDKYIEIKPKKGKSDETEREFSEAFYKGGLLTQESDRSVLLVYGEPWPGLYEILLLIPCDTPGRRLKTTLSYHKDPSVFAVGMKSNQVYVLPVPRGMTRNAIQAMIKNGMRNGGNPFLPLFCPLRSNARGIYYKPPSDKIADDLNADYASGIVTIAGGTVAIEEMKKHQTILDLAYFAARSARFEHGETPRVQRGKPRGNKV